MILLNRLQQRNVGTPRPGANAPAPSAQPPASPLPTINQAIAQPPAQVAAQPAPLSTRLGQLPTRGQVGSMPQWGHIPKRFIADLPANVQLQGIQQILSGQDTNSPIVNNFVKGMAAQGKSPEEIRQAFIAHQKASPNPLVAL